jgi:PGF-pre-PGF domain-containing protein
MLQKIIKSHTIICVLAMLLSIGFCQIGLAAETPTVRIGNAEGSVSDTVDISINIVNASVIGAMDIELTYDANILKATNVVNGAMIESLPDALWSHNISSGKINISLATYPDAINNDGELFIVTFDVVGGNAGDNSTLVTEVEAYTMNASPQPVSVDTEDGVVVVTVKRSGGSSGGSSSSSGSSGSVGVGSSGEASGNIQMSETKIKTVYKNSKLIYNFYSNGNIVQFITFTGLTNSGEIAAKVEMLKKTSTTVDRAPPDTVYKNLNILLGDPNWAISSNIANPRISFKVEKTWISENNIDVSTIKLNRYNGAKWNPLITTQMSGDADYLYFEAETTGFSPFAVTGKELEGEPGGEGITAEPTVAATVEKTPVPTPTEKKGMPGFGLFAGLSVLLIAVQLLRKNK